MRSYIKAMIEDIPEKMKGSLATPAATFLLNTRDGVLKLGHQEKDWYHLLSAKLLYLSQFGRPDICTASAFLTTQVQAPDKDDKRNWER